jgi:PPOX class probable F420-dependent enzyme
MFSEAEQRLLDLPAFAKLATVMRDGSLQNTVMWFRSDGNTLRMIAPEASVKARNLDRNPAVAVAIDNPENGYHYIEIRGRAEIVHDDAAARAELRLIARRYIGDHADAYTNALSDAPRVLIVIHPERVRLNQGQPPRPS